MYNFYPNNQGHGFTRRVLCKILLVMKITTILLFTIILHVSATTLGQKITLKENNAPLTDIFNQISNQTGFDFLFTGSDLKNTKKVSINVKNEELREVLFKIFMDQPLDFTVANKSIVLKEKVSSAFVNDDKFKIAFKQITIRGTIVDSLGNPLPEVFVREKGTQNNVQTDSKGIFLLTLPDPTAVVTISHVGFKTREFTAQNIPSTITLYINITRLREVTINKGYYTEKRALSTGSVSSVSAKEIAQQPVSDPIQALIGRVPGLYIQQQSGISGANSLVRLRGQNSIANGNEPLYIVDGVPYSSTTLTPGQGVSSGALGQGTGFSNQSAGGLSPFNLLNPNNIESIEVLKDADATAIYGSRGANGVILITTKKGRPGNTEVNADFSYGTSKVVRFLDLMNTQQYLEMRQQALALDDITTIPSTAYDLNGAWDKNHYTDWQRTLLGGTGNFADAQVSMAGGNENTQFFIGTGFNRQTAVFPGDFADNKVSMNFNLTHSSTDKRFQLTLSGGYTRDNNTLPQADLTSNALSTAPNAPVLYNADGSLNWQVISGTATFNNPLAYTLRTAQSISNGLISKLALNYRIFDGFTFKVNGGYNRATANQTNITPSTAVAPPNNTNALIRANQFGNSEFSNWIIEPQFNYNRKIIKGDLNVLVGTTFQNQLSYTTGYRSSGYSSDALLKNPSNASNFQFGGAEDILYRYSAIYARLGYTWEDKYLVNLTARRDGSSRFGDGKQFGNFGSVGIGWVFSKEKFVGNALSWLSFGKLRTSYGVTGNDQITPYQYLSAYSSTSFTYQGLTGLFPIRIPNRIYGWEVNRKLEGGLELGFLEDRINLTAGYYRNRSANQLVGYPLSNVSGFNSVQANLPAVLQNAGGEFSLNTANLRNTKLKWNTTFNLSLQANKLISYPDLQNSSYAQQYIEGKSIFIAQVMNYAGVNPSSGVYQFRAINGQITENPVYPTDQILMPKPVTQDFFGMLTNNFIYKGFELDFSFQFVKQYKPNYFGEYLVLQSAGSFNFNLPVKMAGNTWTGPGSTAEYGRLSTQNEADPGYRVNGSSLVYGDASFIRFKNASLSYTLPKKWQDAMRLKNTRLAIQGQNLFTITNYFGLDPEIGSSTLPTLRTIVLRIHTSI